MAAKKADRVKNAMQAPAATQSPRNVVIEQPTISEVVLEVEGTADLLQNNFSQKAVEEMLRKHMGISVQREKKVPRQVIEASKVYNLDGRICIPPVAFKCAMLNAAGQVKGLKKTHLRTGLFVFGSSIPITYEKEVPNMSITRLSGMGRTPDVRFRAQFAGWKARLAIQYNDALGGVQSIVDLLQRAGRNGVGEWRPEKNGTFGTFKVSRHVHLPAEIAQVHAECAVPLKPLVIPEWAMDMEIDPAVLQALFSEQAAGEEEEAAAPAAQ